MKSLVKLLISIGFIIMLVVIGLKVNAQSIAETKLYEKAVYQLEHNENLDVFMINHYESVVDSYEHERDMERINHFNNSHNTQIVENNNYNSNTNTQPVVIDWSNEAANVSNKLSESNIEFNNTVKKSVIGNKTTIDVYDSNTGKRKRYNVTTYNRNSITW